VKSHPTPPPGRLEVGRTNHHLPRARFPMSGREEYGGRPGPVSSNDFADTSRRKTSESPPRKMLCVALVKC